MRKRWAARRWSITWIGAKICGEWVWRNFGAKQRLIFFQSERIRKILSKKSQKIKKKKAKKFYPKNFKKGQKSEKKFSTSFFSKKKNPIKKFQAELNSKFNTYEEGVKWRMMGVNHVRHSVRAKKRLGKTRLLQLQLPDQFDARTQWPWVFFCSFGVKKERLEKFPLAK